MKVAIDGWKRLWIVASTLAAVVIVVLSVRSDPDRFTPPQTVFAPASSEDQYDRRFIGSYRNELAGILLAEDDVYTAKLRRLNECEFSRPLGRSDHCDQERASTTQYLNGKYSEWGWQEIAFPTVLLERSIGMRPDLKEKFLLAEDARLKSRQLILELSQRERKVYESARNQFVLNWLKLLALSLLPAAGLYVVALTLRWIAHGFRASRN